MSRARFLRSLVFVSFFKQTNFRVLDSGKKLTLKDDSYKYEFKIKLIRIRDNIPEPLEILGVSNNYIVLAYENNIQIFDLHSNKLVRTISFDGSFLSMEKSDVVRNFTNTNLSFSEKFIRYFNLGMLPYHNKLHILYKSNDGKNIKLLSHIIEQNKSNDLVCKNISYHKDIKLGLVDNYNKCLLDMKLNSIFYYCPLCLDFNTDVKIILDEKIKNIRYFYPNLYAFTDSKLYIFPKLRAAYIGNYLSNPADYVYRESNVVTTYYRNITNIHSINIFERIGCVVFNCKGSNFICLIKKKYNSNEHIFGEEVRVSLDAKVTTTEDTIYLLYKDY